MAIDTNTYLAEIDKVWHTITDTIDENDIDVDIFIDGSVFTIEAADRSQVIINRQEPKHELWLASTVGAYHFIFDEQSGEWVNTTDGKTVFWSYLDKALNAIGAPSLFTAKY